jgi:hypothetical protein
MPKSGNYQFIVFARDGWIVGRALTVKDSKSVAKFLYEDVVWRYGCPKRIFMDQGTENMDLTRDLLENIAFDRRLYPLITLRRMDWSDVDVMIFLMPQQSMTRNVGHNISHSQCGPIAYWYDDREVIPHSNWFAGSTIDPITVHG